MSATPSTSAADTSASELEAGAIAADACIKSLATKLINQLREVTPVGGDKFTFKRKQRTLLLACRPSSSTTAMDTQGAARLDVEILKLAKDNLAKDNISFTTSVRMIRVGSAKLGFIGFPYHRWLDELPHLQPPTWVDTFRASNDWDLIAMLGYTGLTVNLASLQELTAVLASNGGILAILHDVGSTSYYSAEEAHVSLRIIIDFIAANAPAPDAPGRREIIRVQMLAAVFYATLEDLSNQLVSVPGADLALRWVYANLIRCLHSSVGAQSQVVGTDDGPDSRRWPAGLSPRMSRNTSEALTTGHTFIGTGRARARAAASDGGEDEDEEDEEDDEDDEELDPEDIPFDDNESDDDMEGWVCETEDDEEEEEDED